MEGPQGRETIRPGLGGNIISGRWGEGLPYPRHDGQETFWWESEGRPQIGKMPPILNTSYAFRLFMLDPSQQINGAYIFWLLVNVRSVNTIPLISDLINEEQANLEWPTWTGRGGLPLENMSSYQAWRIRMLAKWLLALKQDAEPWSNEVVFRSSTLGNVFRNKIF